VSAQPRVLVLRDLPALTLAAAERIAAAAAAAVAARGRFVLVLSGGGTPRPLYERLAGEDRERLPWAQTTVLFADERCVPPDDPASNYGMVARALLDHVPLPPEQVHRIAGERAPGAAARDYERALRGALREPRGSAALIDVALLGVGADGHTASLFPGSAALDEREQWVVATESPASAPVRARVTLTFPLLARSREVCFLCAGAEKRAAVTEILAGGAELGGTAPPPAARVHGTEGTVWFLDEAAGGALSTR
jgi:6-phosphogluconolactonase